MAAPLALSLALLLAQPPDAPATPAPPPAELPEEMPYAGGPVPEGYELVTEHNTQLLYFGYSIYSIGYVVAGLYGVIAGVHAVAAFQRGDPFFALIPLAGPFLALGAPAYRDRLDEGARTRHDILLLGSAGLQIIGAAMTAGGYFFPRRVLRQKTQRPAAAPGASAAFAPLGPGGSAGVTLSLAF